MKLRSDFVDKAYLGSLSNTLKTIIFRVILLLSLSVLSAACRKTPELQDTKGFAQGTTYRIQWWSKKTTDSEAIKQDFAETLAQIDKELSTYRKDSYISHFNASQSTHWQNASPEFIGLLDIAKQINRETRGCYDPTIGPLFNLWGFHRNHFKVPSATQIATVKAQIGLDKIQFDKKAGKIRKTLPAVALNLSSMGEGYTIYKLSHVLEKYGIVNYLIEFGGDMSIRGHKPNGHKWHIAIQDPTTKKPKTYQVLVINDDSKGVSLNTSGTYQHFFDDSGKRYSHILNPATGAPVHHDLISASVFGHDPRYSDAWATAMLCLGQQRGKAVAEKLGLSVFFIQEKNGKLIDSISSTLSKQQAIIFK